MKALSGYGVPQEDIAIHMDMDAKTLRKHFRRELDRGTIEANAKVAQTLFTMATVDKNVAAAIFWMKARGGWREKHPIDDLKDKAAEPTTFVYRWATAQGVADEGAERDALTASASASKRIGRTIDHE